MITYKKNLLLQYAKTDNRRVFIKSLTFTGISFLFPYSLASTKDINSSSKTITFLKVPLKKRKFSRIEEFSTSSSDMGFWREFRVIKSEFIKEGRLFQKKGDLNNGLFIILTYYKTKRDKELFLKQININKLKKELSKMNISHFF